MTSKFVHMYVYDVCRGKKNGVHTQTHIPDNSELLLIGYW